jgi:hypothetical protein
MPQYYLLDEFENWVVDMGKFIPNAIRLHEMGGMGIKL